MKKLYDANLNKIFSLGNFFEKKINLSRKKFIISYLLGLIVGRNVQFCEVAARMNEEVEVESNIRRIERFFKYFEVGFVGFAKLLDNKIDFPAGRQVRIPKSYYIGIGVE